MSHLFFYFFFNLVAAGGSMLQGGTWGSCLAEPVTPSTTAGGATQIGKRTARVWLTAQSGLGGMP